MHICASICTKLVFLHTLRTLLYCSTKLVTIDIMSDSFFLSCFSLFLSLSISYEILPIIADKGIKNTALTNDTPAPIKKLKAHAKKLPTIIPPVIAQNIVREIEFSIIEVLVSLLNCCRSVGVNSSINVFIRAVSSGSRNIFSTSLRLKIFRVASPPWIFVLEFHLGLGVFVGVCLLYSFIKRFVFSSSLLPIRSYSRSISFFFFSFAYRNFTATPMIESASSSMVARAGICIVTKK